MSNPILDAALGQRLISKKQYQKALDQLESNPGMDAGDLLLAKSFITPDQLMELQALSNNQSAQEKMENAPLSTSGHSAPTPPPLQQTPPQQSRPAPPSAPDTPPAPPQGAPPQPQPVSVEIPASSGSMKTPGKLKDLLKLARHWGASDLHICVDKPPFVRMAGEVKYLEMDPLTPELAEKLNFQLMTEEQRFQICEDLNLDYSLEIAGQGRFRCNVFHQRLGWNGVYRIIRDTIPTIEELGLPPVAKDLTDYHQGLVLVTGPKGSGKTSSVAAMLDHVNKTREDHVITVEEPVEYIHKPIKCQMTLREIGNHSVSFGMALRAALREDPDIILVGEMRDLETVSIAMSAGETGHLVFGTLHVTGAARTISRIIDTYPVKQRDQVGIMLSESLRGIMSQKLVPGTKEKMALVLEILTVTMGVSSLIRENKLYQLTSIMQSGKKQGMTTNDDSLMKLFQEGAISGRTAFRNAEHQQPFELYKDQD